MDLLQSSTLSSRASRYVPDVVADDNQQLMYPIHYCNSLTKAATEYCVLLPESEAYARSMGVLRTEFGKSHDIAETSLGELFDAKTFSADYANGL